MQNNTKFIGNHLTWEIQRGKNPFRIFVVEPDEYRGKSEIEIFNAVLVELLTSRQNEIMSDVYKVQNDSSIQNFDLLTFPEAFLSIEDFKRFICNPLLLQFPQVGCIHIGLRGNEESHLVSKNEINSLLESLKLNGLTDNLISDDLNSFTKWLNQQNTNDNFNLACLLTVDINKKIRLCLYPKMVRSNEEYGITNEYHMTQGNLLSLVTLQPSDKAYRSITIQPLTCSDALNLDSDQQGLWPISAVNLNSNCFDTLPDRVDIVSVSACTPQDSHQGKVFWKRAFQRTFEASAERNDLKRHNQASFVLSNFFKINTKDVGGLSGAFLPKSFKSNQSQEHADIYWYGQNKDDLSPGWKDLKSNMNSEKSKYFILSIKPRFEGSDLHAQMLEFSFQQMPISNNSNVPDIQCLERYISEKVPSTEHVEFSKV